MGPKRMGKSELRSQMREASFKAIEIARELGYVVNGTIESSQRDSRYVMLRGPDGRELKLRISDHLPGHVRPEEAMYSLRVPGWKGKLQDLREWLARQAGAGPSATDDRMAQLQRSVQTLMSALDERDVRIAELERLLREK